MAEGATGAVPVRGMVLRTVLALVVLGLLSVGDYVLLRRSLEAEEVAASVVRMSGHQRLLAQRIVLLSLRLINISDMLVTRSRAVEILTIADELERSHEALRSAQTSAGSTPAVRAIYTQPPILLDQAMRFFLAQTRSLAHENEEALKSMNPQLAYLNAVTTTSVLDDVGRGLDALVEESQRVSDLRIRDTQRLEVAVLATTLFVLVALGLFAFRPMVMRVRRDIEDLRRAQAELEARAEALERSNAELEQFAYVASHDLQEPLRMIAAYVQLLERRYKGRLGADADECIRYATEGATRMHHLILDLLAFSRVGTHGGSFLPTDLSGVLKDVLDDMKVAIEESGARVEAAELPRLRVDPHQIGQLLQNLIANAIKFRGKEPPVVRIDARREGEEWLFSIRDNGIGFDMRYAERIFVIFQRLHARDRYPGTGIGLAICKKIVERHGGRIWAEAQPGKGATFSFTLSAASS